MELRTLNYFLAVAREQNMTRAAKYLHVSQPALSMQLKALEQELGKQLFVRSNYHIDLTEEGLHLKRRAQDILDLVRKTEEEIKSMDTIGGTISIGSSESVHVSCIAGIVKRFHDEYPQVTFQFYSGNTKLMEEKIGESSIDFAVITQPAVDTTRYHYLKIPKKDIWGVIMRNDDPLAVRERIVLEDLIDRPLIAARQALTEDLPRWFGESMDRIHVVAAYDLLYNAALYVKEGLGIAIGFEKLIHTSEDSGLCYRRLEPVLETEMYVIWPYHQSFTPAGRIFLKRLEKEINFIDN